MRDSSSQHQADPPVTLKVVSRTDGATNVAASGRITRESLADPDPLATAIGEEAFKGRFC